LLVSPLHEPTLRGGRVAARRPSADHRQPVSVVGDGGASAHCVALTSALFTTGEQGMHRRDFIQGAALLGLLPLVGNAGAALAAAPRNGRLLPVPLNPGDTVALVSPSSATDERLNLQLAEEVLQALGFKVKTGAHYAARRGHLAGTDAERAGDLNTMFADDEVRGIVCVRGGAGAARLLPLLDYDAIRANPKVLLGYSDITALHCAILARAG